MEIESLTKCRRMQIAYELTQQDFIEAYSVHRTRNKFSKWTWLLFKWMVGFMTVISLLALAILHNAQTTKELLPFLGLLIFWWLFLAVLPRWTMRRQFLKQPGAKGPRTLSMDDAGVHWRWNGGSADVDWKNYIRTVEGKNLFLFYTSPACFNILPKRGCSD